MVALIITIIILIILAAVTIMTIYDNNFIGVAINATEKYAEEQYKEIDMLDSLNSKLEDATDKIAELNGEQKRNENIKIEYTMNHSEDFTSTIINIEIISNKDIKSVTINDQETRFEEVISDTGEKKYILQLEVDENRKYTIKVKNEDEEYNRKEINVTWFEEMEIYDRRTMEIFRAQVAKGKTFENKTVKVLNNIDLEGSSENKWTPIGTEKNPFKGEFDGNGKTISNIYINGGKDIALFQYNEGTIKNLNIAGIISNPSNAAGIVYQNKGTIKNCTNNINMTSNGSGIISGIAYNNYGIITGCKNKGNLLSGNTDYDCAVGIVVHNYGTIEDCINEGRLSGGNGVGGIAYHNNSIIKRCINIGTINAHDYSGGIAGHNRGIIYNSYNTANVTGTTCIGGIAGYNGWNSVGYIYNCYSINKANIVGGASSSSVTSNCYNSGMTAEILNNGIDDKETNENTESPWQEDGTPNINEGYPILKWQMK